MTKSSVEKVLQEKLKRRKELQTFRSLFISNGIDFSSNDYLGLSRNVDLIEIIHKTTANCYIGATGSRLLSGNNNSFLELEEYLSNYHQAQDCLLVQSGFDANYGLMSCIGGPSDAIFYDEFVHASVHEGVKSSRVGFKSSFVHNNITDFINLVCSFQSQPGSGNIFVVVESVYSMDGDYGDLNGLVTAIESNNLSNVYFIVDEAHSTGITGPLGRGLVCDLGIESKIFARVHTFGKAMGAHGACILGSSLLKQYLLNYCKPVIFSTFLPHHSIVSIKCAYEYLGRHQEGLVHQLNNLINHFRHSILEFIPTHMLLPSSTPIQGLIVPGNRQVVLFCQCLQQKGFDIRPIRSPTVPKGKERIRICMHVHNSIEQIDSLVGSIKTVFMDFNEQIGKNTTIDAAKL